MKVGTLQVGAWVVWLYSYVALESHGIGSVSAGLLTWPVERLID
jgi:hypothetical protein